MIPKGLPVENLSIQCGTIPSNSNTSIQRPSWLAIGLCCPDRLSLTHGLIRPSETPFPPLMVSRRNLLHPRKSAFRWESSSPEFTPLDCARVPPPLPR